MKIEEIKEYLLENEETLKDVVSELNGWNGCLDYLEYYPNDNEFLNTYFQNNLDELARAICYGDYNYTDELVHFNGYANLETCSEWDYENILKDNIDEIIDNLIEEKENINLYDTKLLEMLED